MLFCEMSINWAHGVVVSHPLRMRKALGSIPSVSTCFILPMDAMSHGQASKWEGANVCKAAGSRSMVVVAMVERLVVVARVMVMLERALVAVVLIF